MPTPQHGEDSLARIVVRPIANPLSLGFLGLAGATLVVTSLQLGWIAASQQRWVGLIVVAFAPLLQGVATVYGFLTRDSVATAGMGVLTGTWFCIGLVLFLSPASQSRSGALAMLLFASGTALLVPAFAAVQSKLLAAAVLGLASLRFYVTGAYEITGSGVWKTTAGAVGFALFFLALAAALAFELESVKRRPLPATMRRGRGQDAIGGDVTDELAHIHREAGVREQL